MRKVELLAPAGSMESLIAAVQSGADAVYMGGSKFSARAYASNFDDKKMIEAVEYCHIYGVKVYITLNTLIKDMEIKEVLKYAQFLYNIGVDALIVQDTGLIYLLKKYLPEFEIHASTQMTVHNGEGAIYLKNLGFKRIVLSRELSLNEIKYISKDLNIETEVFIHGALCICYSGQCLMSSVIGGRSGNRGRCAQPCRLPYKLINKTTYEEKKGYILSPKDICTLENIDGIINSGTASLKIEGRMKRPEYVAGVVDIYKRAIDSVYNKEYFDVQKEKRILMQLFNREGFSKAYLFGNIGKDMMAYSFPKNTGIKLGKVSKNSTVVLDEHLNIGDGIRFNDNGFIVSKILKDSKEVEEAFKGDRVILKPTKYRKNDILYKTSDIELLNKLSLFYRNPYDKKIDLKAEVSFEVNKPLTIKTEYEGQIFSVYGEVVQEALKKPLTKERIIKNLVKTGETSFKLNEIVFEAFQEGFLPMSAVNFARRELINKVLKYSISKYKRQSVEQKINEKVIKNDCENCVFENFQKNSMPYSLVVVNTDEQLKAAIDMNMKNIALNCFGKFNNMDLNNSNVENLYLKIPNIIREKEFEKVCNLIEDNLSKVKGIITANLGIFNRFKCKTNIIGDYKLNVLNSCGILFHKDFLNGTYLSIELNRGELKRIINDNKKAAYGVIVYGKYELMVSEYCPVGSLFGGKSESNGCDGKCSNNSFVVKDRKGEEFKIISDKFCRSHIYNNVPTNLIDKLDEMLKMNINSFRLDFTDEDYYETSKVIKNFVNKKWSEEFKKYTRGHYGRGVE